MATRAHRRWSVFSAKSRKSHNEEHNHQEIEYDLGDDAQVLAQCLATSGLAAPDPWEVEPSAKYPGHFYFYNTVTKEAVWSLNKDLFKNPKQIYKDLPSRQEWSHEQEEYNYPARDLDIIQSGQKLHHKSERRPTHKTLDLSTVAAELGEMTKPSTSGDLFTFNKNKAIHDHLAALRDGLSSTIDTSSRASSEPLTSSFLVPLKQPAYPSASADGTPSVEVLAGLGAGGYACVCLVKPAGRQSRDDELMAMKVVSKLRNNPSKNKKRLQTELKLMRDVPLSRFLQRCHAAFESATDVFFVCDYLAGGDLYSNMVKRIESAKGPFPEHEAKNILAEVTLGLVHLHESGFIHRDLKVENVMLDASGHVKIIDFGLALEITSNTRQLVSPAGSLAHMPPELVKSGEKSGGRHTDWWAMGVLAYELMTGRSPWSSLCDKVLIKHEIICCKVRPPTTLSPTARRFIESLLEIDSHRRLGFRDDTEVKRAGFFDGVDWPAVERGDTPAPIKLDSIGPDAVNKADSKKAIRGYTNKQAEQASVTFSEVGKFGVKSPFFVGVDVVASHPGMSGN